MARSPCSLGNRLEPLSPSGIGTTFCITVDFESLENDTVTIRERDGMGQQRVGISALEGMIREQVDMGQLFR